ncbi:MAG: glycosyl hydrolase [Streptosporangiaceae bacterium]
MSAELNAVWAGFADPPDEARPRAWWHWMDGNVDPEGIRLDLEWLYRAGVRGVQMFDGGMGTPLVVPERVAFGSARWRQALQLARATARRLGLEFAVATSPGWSAAGGPWVSPGDAMKKVVWSELVVTGGSAVSHALPPLPDVAGPYQDLPRWGDDPGQTRLARDWVTIAVPHVAAQDALRPATVTASAPIEGAERLGDGRHAEAILLPRDPDRPSSAWIEFGFAAPVTVSAVTAGLPGPAGFGAAPPPHAVLQASDDGQAWTAVAELPASAVPVRTAAFRPVTAARFRLVLEAGTATDALPRLAAGVRLPPVLRRVSAFAVSEFALYGGGRVHQGELKAGFGAAPDYYALDAPPHAAAPAIDPDRVLDLTGHLGADGILRWQAPPGRWRVLRFGASLTGQTNGPAAPDATGLEVDKLDAEPVRRYFDAYLGLIGPGPLDALLSDSIESGPQNWTGRIQERFTELRGYDPLPWLPALAGYVVAGAGPADRFLFDYRRTVSDLLVSEYYATIAQIARSRGLTYYAEALEDHRPQLGDDLAMRAQADVPMGAMWLFDPGSGQPGPTYVADLRGASSVAHVYGKPWTGAESMTAFHRPWSYTPRRLKHIADLELALGVTRFCIHTSPHQPAQVPPPGIGLAPFLGQVFVRTEPWAGFAAPWVDYLARCSFVLSRGLPAVDVAVFTGEEAPLTAMYGDRIDRCVPAGFGFDYVDLDGLENCLRAEDQMIVARGARYRVLYLGGSSRRMTLRALERIGALLDEGATVIGGRPDASPSLADDRLEHARAVRALWEEGSYDGRLVDTDDLASALAGLGLVPSRIVAGAELVRIGRRIGGSELTFLANPEPEPVTATVRAAQPLVSWDPVTARREALRLVRHTGAGGYEYRLDLAPLESVVLADGDGGRLPERSAAPEAELQVTGPWQLMLPGRAVIWLDGGAVPWTELGEEGFAGVGTYTGHVDVDADFLPDRRIMAVLTDVGDIARVLVNGVDCGIAWTAPFEADVTGALHPGRNTVVVEVANAWMNRLIAEARHPTGEIFAPVAGVYEPDAEIRPAGLSGPVVLQVYAP